MTRDDEDELWERTFGDYHFVLHEKRNGLYYGCMWFGDKPAQWSWGNLVKLTPEQFAKFEPVVVPVTVMI